MTDDWMDEELIGILEGKKRPKRRWWAVAARPIPPSQAGVIPPVDVITSATVIGAFSFRKLTSAYAGNALRVKRVSDNAQQDFGFVGGGFDIAGYNAFIGASSGVLITWYDQSGGGYNLTVSGQPPGINMTGVNGNPTLVNTAINNRLAITTVPVDTQPYTFATVAARTGGFTATAGIWGDWLNNVGIYFNNAANQAVLYTTAYSSPVACADNVAHSLIAVFNGASSSLTVDNATTALSIAGTGMQGFVTASNNAVVLTGNISECLCWNNNLSAGDIATLAANQKAYWGTP